MRHFRPRDDVGFANGLESVDSVRILLPRNCKSSLTSLMLLWHLLHLHDLAKTTLTNDLEQLKVVDGQSVLTVFHKVYTNPHLASAK
jgi:hypothetical protein